MYTFRDLYPNQGVATTQDKTISENEDQLVLASEGVDFVKRPANHSKITIYLVVAVALVVLWHYK
jgi:hypothetical protein